MTIYEHLAIDRTPYTYLIGWSWLDIWYYGVRYQKGCHPDDLWTTYFSSSEHVSVQRWLYGDPDIFQIRRTFKSSQEARDWESNVIRRMKMVRDPRFLNKHDPKGKWYNEGEMSEKTKEKLKKSLKESNSKPEVRARRSKSLKEAALRPEVIAKKKETNAKPEVRARRSKSAKEAALRPEVITRLTENRNDPIIQEKIKIGLKKAYEQDGFLEKRGIAIKEALSDPLVKAKHSQSAKEANARPEVKQKIIDSLAKTNQLQEVKDRRSDAAKEIWTRPGFREKIKEKKSNAMKESHAKRKAAKLLLTTSLDEFLE